VRGAVSAGRGMASGMLTDTFWWYCTPELVTLGDTAGSPASGRTTADTSMAFPLPAVTPAAH
jgi:hypothetical protein